MAKIAIMGGSGFKEYNKKGIFFINRHGKGLPPHKIDHKKNLKRIKDKGIKDIIAIFSVGSLKYNIKHGEIVIPDDYINFQSIATIYDKKAVHIVPCVDKRLRNIIISSAKKAKIKTINKGIYYQSHGPRLETKAEVNFLKRFADIVGMNMASEATIANELGMNYAAICSIDNYANGISKSRLSMEFIKEKQERNRKKISKLLDTIISK